MRECKRLIRLLVTDVTLIRSSEHITAHVRLPGGQQHTLTIPRPRTAWEQHTTPAATVALINELLAWTVPTTKPPPSLASEGSSSAGANHSPSPH
jgi:hypothetical protein